MGMKLVDPGPRPPEEGGAAARPARPDGAVDPLLEMARACAGGDRRAARLLVAAVGPAMLRAIRKVCARPGAEVEDLMQEAVEGLLGALPAFKGECTVLHFAC